MSNNLFTRFLKRVSGQKTSDERLFDDLLNDDNSVFTVTGYSKTEEYKPDVTRLGAKPIHIKTEYTEIQYKGHVVATSRRVDGGERVIEFINFDRNKYRLAVSGEARRKKDAAREQQQERDKLRKARARKSELYRMLNDNPTMFKRDKQLVAEAVRCGIDLGNDVTVDHSIIENQRLESQMGF
ncbi:hypothetical protein [Vibrio sp. WXL210]|uniref:hypothetical protein n=1 Tax=Vibrio sp. WXL210 TaxID=3450709 RepID=UPI003EC5E55B